MFIFFLSYLSLHFINCVCRVSCLYEVFTLLSFHIYSVTVSFPYLLFFFYCLRDFRPTFFSLRVKFNCLLSVNFLWVSWFTPLFAESSWLQTYTDRAEFSYTVPSLLTTQVPAFCNFARDATSIKVEFLDVHISVHHGV